MTVTEKPTNDLVSVLMIEAGAQVPWEMLDHSGEDCLILAQQSDETPMAFADRVHSRLRKSLREGHTLRRAVIAAGPRWSRDAQESRERIMLTLAPRCPTLVSYQDLDPDSQAA